MRELLERYERSKNGAGKRNGCEDSGALDGDLVRDLFGGRSDAAKLAAKSTVADGGADRFGGRLVFFLYVFILLVKFTRRYRTYIFI